MVGEEQCLRNAADTTANTECSDIAASNQFQPLPNRDNPASSIPSGFWGASLSPFNAYSFIPASYDAPWVIRETDTAITNEQTTLRFAIRADMNILPGTYTNTVVFTAIANPEPPALIYIQEINQLNCPTTRTMVTDARDYRTYWVQRMPDGRCWMQTNLAYAGGGNNTFGDVVDLWNLETVPDWSSPNFMIPPYANPTAFPNQPSLATDGGVNESTRQFGYLYNWCAAMGGQSAACDNTMNPNVDTSVSVCPAGWRLPTDEQGTGEFNLFNNAVNGGATNNDVGLRTQWLGMYGGRWSGSFSGYGLWGSYWSSTQRSDTGAALFGFESDSVDITDGDEKTTGVAVRCIAEPIYIQEVNEDNCPEERTMVVDARDNRTYWVQQMPDGRCWMQTNLAYAGGGDNRFGDVVSLTNNESTNSFTSANFMRPPDANPTTFPQAPSTATDGGADPTTRQYGYLYNWCAAMGGQSAACTNALNDPDRSVSICPAGWRLPTAGADGATAQNNNTNEFWNLNQAVNGGLTNTDAGLRTQWLGMYSGNWISGTFNFVGAQVLYWSSTQSNLSTNARVLALNASLVNSTFTLARQNGGSVRCIAEPPPERIYIQEINDINCPTNRTMVVDARDNRTYWVQRMPDGRCWMQTNLAYAGGGDNTFGDVVNGLNENTNNSFTEPRFGRPSGANPTTFPDRPSTAIDGGSDASTRQFGYLYNWCAAMGGQSAACANATNEVDTSVSICPAGWRLPIAGVDGGATINEFQNLNQAVNGGSTTADAGLRTNWLAMYSGNWWNNTFSDAGFAGGYWSSTHWSSEWGVYLDFTESGVDPGNALNKQFGISVRCIAEPAIFIQDINNSNCPTARTMVVDARDLRTYWVQRMPDGRCWMLTNLAYAGGGDNRFGDVVSGLVENTTNSFTEPRFGRPSGSNPTTFPDRPSTATDGGVNIATRQFGYLYNWCAAMGGPALNPLACANALNNPNRNVSICPAGWRLPTGGADGAAVQNNNTNEFWNLNQAVNGGLTTTDVGLRTQWFAMRSGQWSNGSFTSAGMSGQYWSSTQSNVTVSARPLQLLETIVNPSNALNKQTGQSIRCIVP